MWITIRCEKCGGETRTRGCGDGNEYVRKHYCQQCHHRFYTIEHRIDDYEGRSKYNGYVKIRAYQNLLREKEEGSGAT